MVDGEDPDKGGIYELYWTEEGEDLHYLSIAAQIDGSAFFLGFWVPEGITGLKAAEHRKRMHAFFQENPELREYGFEIRKDGYMFTRFSFDPKKLSEEYPDGFTESLNPLDEAFDRVLKAHPVFDKFVKSFDKGILHYIFRVLLVSADTESYGDSHVLIGIYKVAEGGSIPLQHFVYLLLFIHLFSVVVKFFFIFHQYVKCYIG